MKRLEYPSSEELWAAFYVDPEEGILYRKMKSGKLKPCCLNDTRSHPDVSFKCQKYSLHVILFIMYNGFRPDEVDHKDTNSRNNKKNNLREANRAGNNSNRNQQSNNTSGFKGVSWEGSSWRYQVRHKGKSYSKRGFSTAEEAFEASVAVRKSLHKEFTNFG